MRNSIFWGVALHSQITDSTKDADHYKAVYSFDLPNCEFAYDGWIQSVYIIRNLRGTPGHGPWKRLISLLSVNNMVL